MAFVQKDGPGISLVSRRGVLQRLGTGGMAAALVPELALAQDGWPAKPVTLVVGYPPGGQTDFAGRILTATMQQSLGQSVVIDNKPGVNGNIATDYIAKSAPDGYRLLVGNGSNMVLNPHTYRNTPVADPLKLTPIGLLLTSGLLLVVPANLPVKTVEEFIAWVRQQDKEGKIVDYASGGPGSLVQTTMELFRERIGKPKMSHVPYKGSAPAMTDLVAGRIPCMFDAASVVAPFVKSGQLKALMATGPQRIPIFPEIPTATERGIKDFQVISFIGMYGPAGLSPDIVRKVNTATNAALKDPKVLKTIADRGDEPGGGTPEQLGAMTRDNYKLLGEVVKNNDIRAE